MSNFIQSVDERTKLAGANQLEVLLFSMGKDSQSQREEVFGINVFKVREVMHVPEITHAPDMPEAVEGMVSLRGMMIPVVNLPKFCGIHTDDEMRIMIVTEFNTHVQGFLVHAVDHIERLAWEDIKLPPPMIANRLGGLVTAVTELEANQLVMILDVEKVLSETTGFYEDDNLYSDIQAVEQQDITVLFADDSSIARKQIIKTLEKMGLNYISATTGQEAWKLINEQWEKQQAAEEPLADKISLVLTDIEMPEMDGYVLTRNIKGDSRFQSIPVIMHSSLSADSNQSLGAGVGADAYVPKFKPFELSKILRKVIMSIQNE